MKGMAVFYSTFGNNWKLSVSFEQLCILKRILQFCITVSAGTGSTAKPSCLRSGKPAASAGLPGRGAGVWAQR